MFDSRQRRACSALVALLTVTACGRDRRIYAAKPVEPETKVVRIGTFASLSGPDAAFSADYQRGIRGAIDAWNAGVDGRRLRLELQTYDDRSRASATAAAVERFAREDRVAIVVGGFDTERVARAAAAAKDVLVACPGCAAESEANVVALAPSFHERAEVLADLVTRTMNLSRVAILAREGNAVDRAVGDAFRASLKSRGVATDDAVTFTPQTINEVLAKLSSDAPQAVFVTLDGSGAALVGRALRRRAVPSALLFHGTPDLAVLPEADRVSALEGALFPGFGVPGSADSSVCDAAAERELLGLDAATRLCRALETAEAHDPATLERALARVAKSRSLQVAQVKAGRFLALRP